LLIDGPWGSGKTTYYKNNYQYIDDKPNIYINCFSASRSELIAQIIQQQFLCKLLTLNGLLAKLMESNWQIFMPSNRIVVFDDLERLHANEENYLDLIGIIDYLKDKMKCQIILICNISELKEPIFNTYMERIVDETEFPILMSKEEFKNSLIENPNDLIKELLVRLYSDYASGKINNLRIIKNIMPKIAKKLESDYSKFNEVEQVLNGSQHEINALISKHYLFYNDNTLFKRCVEFYNNKKILYTPLDNEEPLESQQLLSMLNKYKISYDQQAQTFFKCQDYKTWRDIGEILQPNFNDFLRLDIEANLKLGDYVIYDDGIRIQNLVIQYLEKYINKNTRNNFDSGDYALWFLFILWIAKPTEYKRLSWEIFLNQDFMTSDNHPVKDVSSLIYSYLDENNARKYKQLFKIEQFEREKFLIEYYNFYRDRIVDKFICSIDEIDRNALTELDFKGFAEYCTWGDGEDENKLLLTKSDSRVFELKTLYSGINKCVNLYVIKKWIASGVLESVLVEYYMDVVKSLKVRLNSFPLLVRFIDTSRSCEELKFTDADPLPKMLVEYGWFLVMRNKLFKFKKIVEAYIKSNEVELQKFTEYNNDNLEIIEKLFVEISIEDNSTNIDKENNESAT